MRPVRGVVWGCALAVLTAGAQPCRAAWDNVFQVCCNSCGSASASYAPPADPCCTPCPPQQVCTTHYEQRCYYQPVTCYQSRTYYEPVTTYRTSYYYEPVTSYRYSSYYDPCSCTCQQVACPVTCYQLRSQCCPVQSWVQRCCSVPVTTYKQCSYWEPVTTCCQVPCNSCAAPAPACPQAAPAVAAPAAPAAPVVPYTPGVIEQRNNTAPPLVPGVSESRDAGSGGRPYNNYTPGPSAPPASYNHQVAPTAPRQPSPPPVVRLDRIVFAPVPRVEGQVVTRDHTPRAGAEVLFVSAERRGSQHTVKADARGQFNVALASGGAWLVYVRGGDGKLVPQGQIRVKDEETRRMTLVSR